MWVEYAERKMNVGNIWIDPKDLKATYFTRDTVYKYKTTSVFIHNDDYPCIGDRVDVIEFDGTFVSGVITKIDTEHMGPQQPGVYVFCDKLEVKTFAVWGTWILVD